jgi:hypothetical protein
MRFGGKFEVNVFCICKELCAALINGMPKEEYFAQSAQSNDTVEFFL